MKIAVITDAHGNAHGLEAVLHDIEMERPDLIFCAGDMVNPLPNSPKIWNDLRKKGIPMIMGNNEDSIIRYHSEEPNYLIKESVRFMPVQYTAKKFSLDDVNELRSLPLNRLVEGPNGYNILICHASPFNLFKSIADEIDEEMATDLLKVDSKTIVVGHYHKQWNRIWMDKQLIMSGSCGWPDRKN